MKLWKFVDVFVQIFKCKYLDFEMHLSKFEIQFPGCTLPDVTSSSVSLQKRYHLRPFESLNVFVLIVIQICLNSKVCLSNTPISWVYSSLCGLELCLPPEKMLSPTLQCLPIHSVCILPPSRQWKRSNKCNQCNFKERRTPTLQSLLIHSLCS